MADKKAFFTEIVGLRIYLATWVAIGHGLQLSGFLAATNPVLRILLSGHDAVVIFMIVSGFVIANLLTMKQESYPRYITRRFFRLYPVYVLACIAGYFLVDEWAMIAQTVPWGSSPAAIKYAHSVVEMGQEATGNFLPHFVAHVFMLHGLLPNEVLLRAPMTFLPAAWSISLEWQFYLLAPLILGALKDRWRLVGLMVISLLALALYRKGLLGHYAIGSTIFGNIHYFLIGICSRLAYERLAAFTFSPVAAAAVVVFVSLAMIEEPLPFIIWGVFLSYSLWHRSAPMSGAVFRTMMQSRPAQLLGEASYSLYLIHRPVQVALAALLMGSVVITRWSMLAIQMTAILAAIPISILLYFSVERWGIRVGQKVARKIPAPEPPAEPFPVPAAVEIGHKV